MSLRAPVFGFILFALVGCGQEQTYPQKPQLITDRDSLGFGLEFGSATYIGQQPQDSLSITNKGLQDLTITSVDLRGDPAFTKLQDSATHATLKTQAHAFITLAFKPTQQKDYSAQLIITSNADNFPSKVITIAGRGCDPSATTCP